MSSYLVEAAEALLVEVVHANALLHAIHGQPKVHHKVYASDHHPRLARVVHVRLFAHNHAGWGVKRTGLVMVSLILLERKRSTSVFSRVARFTSPAPWACVCVCPFVKTMASDAGLPLRDFRAVHGRRALLCRRDGESTIYFSWFGGGGGVPERIDL